MTFVSFNQLLWFFNTFSYEIQKKKNIRIGDYGGTSEIGQGMVKQMLTSGGIDTSSYFMLDYDNGVDLLNPIEGPKFDLGICCDLLEHTSQPFKVAKNICDSLNPKSLLFVTVPFIWEVHYFPNDYFRFTPNGLAELFKEDMDVLQITLVRDLLRDELAGKKVPNDPNSEDVTAWVERNRVVGIFRKK